MNTKEYLEYVVKEIHIVIVATVDDDTMNSVAISIRGKVRDLGFEKIPELFEKNQYMYQIYPTEESMKVLSALW